MGTGRTVASAATGMWWPARRIALSPDGSLVAVASSWGTQFWHAADAALTLGWPGGPTRAVAFAPVGMAFAADGASWFAALPNRAYRADVPANRRLAKYALPRDDITAAALSPCGRRFAAGCRNGSVLLTDVATEATTTSGPLTHPSAVKGLSFAPDGQRLATITERTLRVIHLASGVRGWRMSMRQGLRGVAFAPDGRTVLVAGNDRQAATFDAATGAQVGRLELGVGPIRCLAVSAGGTVGAACGGRKTAVVWDLET